MRFRTIALLAICLLTSGCSRGPERSSTGADLTGTWTGNVELPAPASGQMEQAILTMTFEADGSMTSVTRFNSSEYRSDGTYQVQGDTLSMTTTSQAGSGTLEEKFTLAGDVLTLEGLGLVRKPAVLKKQGQ